MNTHLTLFTDKYQINMMYAHFLNGTHNKKVVFDLFFRKLPEHFGYAVFVGLERIVHYIHSLHFTESDIEYLRKQPEQYSEEFLEELKKFHFEGNIYSVKEGTIVFPKEPLLRIEGKILETQLIETALLSFVNAQTGFATKASRVKLAAGDDLLLEFGARRAQEVDMSIWGTRAASIVGFDATSNMLAGETFDIMASGTHAHSFVQFFPSELEAFRTYAKAHPNQTTLLVDTYDTLKSGVPNAIIVAKELEEKGDRLKAIRLDSGNLSYLSIQARRLLDEAGLEYVKIIASNDLDETIIHSLKKEQGAKIDGWGVGTKTYYFEPLGAVYKLVAIQNDEEYKPVIKLSSSPEKITTPGKKKVYRLIDKEAKKSIADYILFDQEVLDPSKRLKLFDEKDTWKMKFIKDYQIQELLVPIFQEGKLVYSLPSLSEVKAYHKEQLSLFWEDILRLVNPDTYFVNLSQEVFDEKQYLIYQMAGEGA